MMEKVEFKNSRGEKIVGILTSSEKEKPPIVIIIHGFKGAKEYYPMVNNAVKPLVDSGIAVLRIDCRGTGESDCEFKDMTVKSESEDILTAIDYVKTLNIDKERIGLIGISMGADAILMAMEKKLNVKTIVFWGPGWMFKGLEYFDTPENRKTVGEEGVFYVTAKLTGQKLVAGKELFKEFRELDIRPYMKFVEVPNLILRGSKDDVSTPEQDREARGLLNAEYVLIENGDHNFLDKRAEEELIEKTLNWFNKWLV